MFYEEEIQIERAEPLLRLCGLTAPEGVDYTVGVYDDSGRLAATGSLKGDMIQGIAVDPARQGEDLAARVLTHLIARASGEGMASLCLYTKPEKAIQFQGLGFRTVAVARPYAALMEWGSQGIEDYLQYLRSHRTGKRPAAALVMNCNPFTRGHRFLVEQAAKEVACVYLLVVEEDKSLFSFADRLAMVRAGVADLDRVVVLSGGRYAVSSLTFPSYFTKEEKLADAHTAMDAELFARKIAPALEVDVRFIGQEPLSPVTAVYNRALHSRLPQSGIRVEELPRMEVGGDPVSASRVRALLRQLWKKDKMDEDKVVENGSESSWLCDDVGQPEFEELSTLVPETTMEHLQLPEMQRKLSSAFGRRKK